MMSLVIGLGNLAIGMAYAGLGLLSAWETISLHRYRGWSRFGTGFSLMAASCGPHHLVHGWHVLQGESVSWPMFIATVMGLPAGLIFVWLRFETMWGGEGERLVAASPDRAVLLAGAFTIVASWLAAWAFAVPGGGAPFQVVCTSAGLVTYGITPAAGIDFVSVRFLANIFVTLTYGTVGWYLAGHQVRRHLVSGAWSLSGVALAGVFFTCAQMHLIDATTGGHGLMLVFDLIGIPASVTSCGSSSRSIATPCSTGTAVRWSAPPPCRRVLHHGAVGACSTDRQCRSIAYAGVRACRVRQITYSNCPAQSSRPIF